MIVKDFNELPEPLKNKLRKLSFADRNTFMTAISEGRAKMTFFTKQVKRKLRRRVKRARR